jgi:hypothetical protein
LFSYFIFFSGGGMNINNNIGAGSALLESVSAVHALAVSKNVTSDAALEMLLDYMNILDKDAAAREAHAADPQAAMKKFGLSADEEAAVMSGDKKKMAVLAGIAENAAPGMSIQLNITTY